jgi:hypothetical protein
MKLWSCILSAVLIVEFILLVVLAFGSTHFYRYAYHMIGM